MTNQQVVWKKSTDKYYTFVHLRRENQPSMTRCGRSIPAEAIAPPHRISNCATCFRGEPLVLQREESRDS